MTLCENCIHKNVCGDPDEHALTFCDDFSDNSEWVHLPCKIGTELYVICHDKNKCEFCIVKGKLDRVWIGDYAVYSVSLPKDDYVFKSEDFSKTVFLSKEAAEKALEKRRKK